MKRGLSETCQDGGGSSMTPSKGASRRVAPPLKSICKKQKQGTIRRFLAPSRNNDEKETPVLFPRRTGKDASWSSGVRKLERLAVRDSAQREPRRLTSYQTASKDPAPSAFATPAAVEPVTAAIAAASPAGGGICDEFVISCTQDYERGSQAITSPDLLPCVSQEPSFRFQQSCGQSQVSITEEFGYFASTGGTQLCIQTQVQQQSTAIAIEEDQPCTQPDTRGPPIPDNPAAVAADPHATTPDLGMFGSTESSCTLAKPLFNIFLPKSEQRQLIIIRHGESEFNRAMEEPGNGFKDPMIFDPPLTSKGREQARGLREKLGHELSVNGDALWVVSPLRRAIETFLLACPLAAEVAPGGRAGRSSGILRISGTSHQLPMHGNIEVQPLIAEFCMTAGDVGSRASTLARDFPQVAHKLAQLPETWWYQEPRKPNCAASKTINSLESRAHQKQRVGEFARWLSKRPEKFVILIGHCSFWKEFSRTSDPMKNGEMRRMRW